MIKNYRNSSAYCTKAGVGVAKGNKFTMLDANTGSVRWQGKFTPVQFDDSTNIVLGYSGPRSSKLSGYNMTTGQLLWTASMPHDKNWGWNHVIREDSVHWLVVADDLNRLNIQTGEVCAFDAKTGVSDVKGALLQGLVMAGAAVAGAMATGYAAYPVVRDGVVYGSPWSGKTPCYRNVSFPIGGIVMLSQAPYNKIRRLKGIEAYVAVVESIGSKVWDNRIAESQHQTENTLASTVPMWHLECLPDEGAARLCHDTITNIK